MLPACRVRRSPAGREEGYEMTDGDQASARGIVDVYLGFVDAMNRRDLDDAERFVDPARYRENCVGFTPGFVDWPAAKASLRRVWKGLPDLRLELPHVLANGDAVVAQGL